MEIKDAVTAHDVPWSWGDVEEALTVHTVETDEATILFGAGDESTADDVVSVATEYDVDVVVAEHGDVDHYEGIPFLQDALDVTVAIPAGDAGVLEEAGIEYDVGLEGGETYWGVQTVSVPGHTPDNMAFLYGDVLIAGDTVAGSDSAFAMDGAWSGPLAPLAEQLNYDTERTLKSVSTLLEYELTSVLTAHGQSALEDGDQAVETLMADIEAGAMD
ncbi:MAG: hypothetical protein ABEJ55_05805 [Halanaeroarchaeum sp.]